MKVAVSRAYPQNDKIALSDKASELVGKKNDLEAYLGGLAKKLFLIVGVKTGGSRVGGPELCV